MEMNGLSCFVVKQIGDFTFCGCYMGHLIIFNKFNFFKRINVNGRGIYTIEKYENYLIIG